MLKNKKNIMIISIIFVVLIGSVFVPFIVTKNASKSNLNAIIFTYPEEPLSFAGEDVPNMKKNYEIKEKFDKEFLNISYNLYQFFLYVKRMPLYMDTIQNELNKQKVPLDFQYLPIVESALRQDAESHANAAGIWQFMPETAKEYGLIVNEYVDERYHFEKSTQAAIRYLKTINKSFNNWTLTAASYNRGPNAIKKALKEQNTQSYYDLYLNEETARYVYKILAIKYVILQYEANKKYIDTIIGGTYEKKDVTTISVSEIGNILDWSKENGYSYQEIKSLNPWIRKESLPKGNRTITVPK